MAFNFNNITDAATSATQKAVTKEVSNDTEYADRL